jgi:hydroxymethylglutaryl-CoA lyase
MQGISDFIPTENKIDYLNKLLEVGFDTLDFGSFVSPKAIPQLKDTHEVVQSLNLSSTATKLLAIIANERGAEDAMKYPQIDYLGFPLSISETFQQRNTNKSIGEAMEVVKSIQNKLQSTEKELVVYISMGFGNPYGDPYNEQTVFTFIDQLVDLDIRTISLADTVGKADDESIRFIFQSVFDKYSGIEFGAHLHAHPDQALSKVRSAYEAGCRRFDGALKGFGGCPMAGDQLVGNIPTELIISEFDLSGHLNLDMEGLKEARIQADSIFIG